MQQKYIFKSERLGFRNWNESDLPEFSKINADKDVMEYFPKTLTSEDTANFIKRLQKHTHTYGFCYFATEVLSSGEFIGFIGLAYQKYESPFTPAVDIGWRLKKSAWNLGYATEGAKKCLDFAFNTLKLNRIIATCAGSNLKSENVMKKIGMKRQFNFIHPLLKENKQLKNCVLYEINK